MPARNATIGALHVKLGLDTAQFETGLKTSRSSLAGFVKTAGLGLAGVAAAAAGAGLAIAAGVKSAIDSMDELSKASQKVGVGVEALSKLAYAGDLADVSLDQLSTGLVKLDKNIAAVAGGASGPAADAFRALGISVTDATGGLKSGDQVLADVAEQFAHMEDGAGKTALAVQLFGKSGAELIPLLNAGKAGLKEMGDEAQALGIVIDEKTGKAAEEFNDNLTRLQTAGRGVTTQLAAQLAPALASISAGLVNSAKNAEVMKGVGLLLGGTLKVLATAAVGVAVAFGNLGRGIATVAKAIVQVFRGDFAGAFDTLKTGITDNLKALANAGQSVRAIWSSAGTAVAKDADHTSDLLAAPIVQAAGKAAAGAKKIDEAAKDAVDAARYIADQQRRLSDVGRDGNQSQAAELQARASEFKSKGLDKEAAAAHALAESYLILASVQVAEVDVAKDVVVSAQEIEDGFKGFTVDAPKDFEKVADAFYEIGNAVDDVFYGVANNDWVGAFSGLTRALGQVSEAFGETGTAAGKFAALAGVANAVGGAVGGVAGAGISGAASGALAGFQLGGPVGAAIGGILGGLGGIFGASKAKKRAKKEAAERARLEAERKAAEEASIKRALEIELMRLGGDAAGARAAEEADLLATLSPANAELQKHIFALEREAEVKAAAEAAAAQLVADRRRLEAELASALGDSSVALKFFREEALAGLPDALKPLQQLVFDAIDAGDARAKAEAEWASRIEAADERVARARDAAAEAGAREIEKLEAVRDKFADLADTLASFRAGLSGGKFGGLSATALAASTRKAFNSLSAKAARGDADAAAALPDAITAFLEANNAIAPNARAQAANTAAARKSLIAAEAAARSQVSLAQQAISLQQSELDAAIGTRDAVLSLDDTLAELSNALFDQALEQTRAMLALEAIAAQIAPALAALGHAVNDNALNATTLPAALDPAAVTAALDATAAGGGVSVAATGGMVLDLTHHLEDQTAMLQKLVISSNFQARILDDVTQGGDALRTQAA